MPLYFSGKAGNNNRTHAKNPQPSYEVDPIKLVEEMNEITLQAHLD